MGVIVHTMRAETPQRPENSVCQAIAEIGRESGGGDSLIMAVRIIPLKKPGTVHLAHHYAERDLLI